MRGVTLAVMAFIAAATGEASESYGRWLSETDDGHYAVTMNDSENLLGQWCYPESGTCIWMIGIKTACKEGARVPCSCQCGHRCCEPECSVPRHYSRFSAIPICIH